MDIEIFKGLTPHQQEAIINISESCSALAGEILIQKNEEKRALYVLLEGELQVLEKDEVIAEIKPGSFVGELGFWAKQRRSATVRAKTDGRYLKIERHTLEQGGISSDVLNQLDNNIMEAFGKRFRETNSAYSNSLKKQLKLEREKNHFGSLFIIVSFLMIISSVINYMLQQLSFINAKGPWFTWPYILLLGAPIFCYCAYNRTPLNTIGFNTQNAKRTIQESLIICVILILAMTALPWLKDMFHWNIPKLRYFSFTGAWWRPPLYLIHSGFQELIGRGIVQQSLMNFFGPRKNYIAVLIASVMFGMLHLYLGMGAVFVTLIAGLIFGTLYVRQRNIYGVSIVHGILGFCAMGIGLIPSS